VVWYLQWNFDWMLLTNVCLCDGSDRGVLVGWCLQGSVGGKVLTGEFWWDGTVRGVIVGCH
jgi:hypothetical protein